MQYRQVVDFREQWFEQREQFQFHYDDAIMSTMASQFTSLTIVYSAVYSGADQRKHQSSASLAFVLGIHREPMNSPHKRSVTQKMFPLDDVIMFEEYMKRKYTCTLPRIKSVKTSSLENDCKVFGKNKTIISDVMGQMSRQINTRYCYMTEYWNICKCVCINRIKKCRNVFREAKVIREIKR